MQRIAIIGAGGFAREVEWLIRDLNRVSPQFEFAGMMVGTVVFWAFLTLLGATITAFGMWMGLREKSPNAAFFKTIAFTLLPILFGWCFLSWFGLPVAYIILLAISIANLPGASLRRLLRNEKAMPEMTPVRIPRSYEVPPVIKT